MTAPAPARPDTDRDSPDVDHACCPCTPDRAVCGTDVSDVPWSDAASLSHLCVVCRDLIAGDWTCPHCGEA